VAKEWSMKTVPLRNSLSKLQHALTQKPTYSKSTLFLDVVVKCSQKTQKCQVLWLMPIIPGTQEAEIGRIEIQSQPRQIVRDPISKKPITEKGWWSGSTCRP
jgi:hypothetical protein